MLHLGSRTSVNPVHHINKFHQHHRLQARRTMCHSVAPEASQSKIQELYRLAKVHLSGRPPSQDAAAEIAEALSESSYICFYPDTAHVFNRYAIFCEAMPFGIMAAGAIPLRELGVQTTDEQQVRLDAQSFHNAAFVPATIREYL